ASTLPILISVSEAPVSYFFCANAPCVVSSDSAAAAASKLSFLFFMNVSFLVSWWLGTDKRKSQPVPAGGYEAMALSAAFGVLKFFLKVGLWIFPVALRGKASTNSIWRGHLNRARLAAQCAWISSAARV